MLHKLANSTHLIRVGNLYRIKHKKKSPHREPVKKVNHVDSPEKLIVDSITGKITNFDWKKRVSQASWPLNAWLSDAPTNTIKCRIFCRSGYHLQIRPNGVASGTLDQKSKYGKCTLIDHKRLKPQMYIRNLVWTVKAGVFFFPDVMTTDMPIHFKTTYRSLTFKNFTNCTSILSTALFEIQSFGPSTIRIKSTATGQYLIMKRNGCIRGSVSIYYHDIKSRSLTWNYFIFELSTVWLQSSTGRIKSNKVVCSIYTSDERK